VDRHRAALSPPTWAVVALASLPVVVLAAFYAWPVGTLLARVLSGQAIADTFDAPGVAGVLRFTAWQAAVSTALTMLVGFVPASVLGRYRFAGRRVVLAAVTVPFMLPTVVVGAAFLAMLPQSLHGTALAIVLAHVFFNIAVVVRLVGSMWSVIPADLTGAARTLGASPARALWHVALPLLRPAMVAAATVVFLFTFTSYGVVVLLGGPTNVTLEVEVARRATQLGDVDGAAVLSMLQLLILAFVVWWSSRWQRKATRQLGGAPVLRRPRSRGERWLVPAAAFGSAALMAVPLVVLVSRSFRVGDRFSLEAWRRLDGSGFRPGTGLGVDPLGSLATSLHYAAVATVIAVVIGAAAAFAISAARRRGGLLDVGVMLPLGTSAVTLGFGLLITFDTAPFDWRGKWWMVPLGHALVAIPFVVRALLPVLRSIPDDQRAAAATLGASPLRTWWWVDARRAVRPILAGAGFAAAISLGEFGATTFLTRAGQETMPIAVGRLLGRVGDVPRAQAFALATILLVVTAIVVVLADVAGTGSEADRARRS